LLLLLPELALPGFFSAGALLTCPAAAAHQAVAVAVLSGGDGAHYVPGRELVHAGFSSRLVLIGPRVTARKDALATLRFVAIWDKVTPANSWGEAQTTRCRSGSWKARRSSWATICCITGLACGDREKWVASHLSKELDDEKAGH